MRSPSPSSVGGDDEDRDYDEGEEDVTAEAAKADSARSLAFTSVNIRHGCIEAARGSPRQEACDDALTRRRNYGQVDRTVDEEAVELGPSGNPVLYRDPFHSYFPSGTVGLVGLGIMYWLSVVCLMGRHH